MSTILVADKINIRIAKTFITRPQEEAHIKLETRAAVTFEGVQLESSRML